MANSTTNLDTISSSQASKEITANALFDAGSPATIYGRRASTTTALTWGFYGGYISIAGTPTSIANGTVALTGSTTNYVVASRATGAVSTSTATTNWNSASYIRLYQIVTGTSSVTSYTDHRTLLNAETPYGALQYQGTWNASTNTPTLASGVGTKGYYYAVSAAGTTSLDGIASWSVGDWAIYNGTAWQKLEGGITSGEIIAALGYTPVEYGGALGTPSSGTLDNCTSNTETAANNSTQLATTAYADRLTAGTLAGAFTTLSATDAGTTPFVTRRSTGIPGSGVILPLQLQNASAAYVSYADLVGVADDVTAGSEDGSLQVRVMVAGASTTKATFSSTGLAVTGQVSPSAHNTYDLGTTGVRWKDLWLQSGAFNGSDARLKTSIAPLTANEINAAKQLSKEIGTYQWLESVQKKGDAARHHVGFTVQRAIEILQLNGCDPFSYGFIGYDKWDDVFVEHAEILPVEAVDAKEAASDADGNVIEPAVVAVEAVEGKAAWTEHKTVAGDAYSFRYDQLNMFVAAGLEARLAALEAK